MIFAPRKVFSTHTSLSCIKSGAPEKAQPSTNFRNMWPGLLVVRLENGLESISKRFVVNHSTATCSLKDYLQFIYQWKGFYITGNLPRPDSSQELIERCCMKSPRIQRWHQWIYSPLLAQSRVEHSKETALLCSVCDTHEEDKCGAIC